MDCPRLLIALLAMLCVSCVSPREEVEAMVGATAEQLRTRYGEPSKRTTATGGESWAYVTRDHVRRQNPERILFVVREPSPPPPAPQKHRLFYEPYEPFIYRDYVDTMTFVVGADGKVREASYHREWGYERKGY